MEETEGQLPEQPAIACDKCDLTTDSLRVAMDHATRLPGHVISGPGRIEGTTVSISFAADDDDEEDWD